MKLNSLNCLGYVIRMFTEQLPSCKLLAKVGNSLKVGRDGQSVTWQNTGNI